MNVIEQDDHLLKIKLVLKSTEKFTDEEAANIFLDTKMQSLGDLAELETYLQTYRPLLYEKFSAYVRRQKKEFAGSADPPGGEG